MVLVVVFTGVPPIYGICVVFSFHFASVGVPYTTLSRIIFPVSKKKKKKTYRVLSKMIDVKIIFVKYYFTFSIYLVPS